MTTRVAAVLGFAALGVVLAACTGTSSHPSSSGSTTTAGSAPAASTSAPATSASTSAPSQNHHGSGSSSPTGHTVPSTTLTTVAPVPVVTRPAVPLRSTAPFGNGVYARIVSIVHGKVAGQGPGVIAGQAQVLFTVRLANGSAHPIRLDTVQVTATYGRSATPATPSAEQSRPFSGRLRSGASARGTYAFAVPQSAQGQVSVTISYAQGVPVVVLHGSAH